MPTHIQCCCQIPQCSSDDSTPWHLMNTVASHTTHIRSPTPHGITPFACYYQMHVEGNREGGLTYVCPVPDVIHGEPLRRSTGIRGRHSHLRQPRIVACAVRAWITLGSDPVCKQQVKGFPVRISYARLWSINMTEIHSWHFVRN